MSKILVIDDEPSIVNLVTAYLKPEGYEVYTASDGPAGLKAAPPLARKHAARSCSQAESMPGPAEVNANL
jgi:CheY-like chemotaxis protein